MACRIKHIKKHVSQSCPSESHLGYSTVMLNQVDLLMFDKTKDEAYRLVSGMSWMGQACIQTGNRHVMDGPGMYTNW